MGAARGQRVEAAFCAPGQVAAQVGLGVVAGGVLEAGQVGSHCQPQLISERHQVIGGDGRQFGEGHHAQTLRLLLPADEPCEHARRGMCAYSRPALAMHKHAAPAAACLAVLRTVNGEGALDTRALSRLTCIG